MERFSRLERLLGPEAVERLCAARVTVAGLGAVGSYAVEGLARSGIGALGLVDFDRVETTNINRQLFALEGTIGELKTAVAGRRVRDINPDCRVEEIALRITAETADSVLEPPPDILVDAIDSFASKADLLEKAWRRGIPVVSSMGAALHRDPLSVRIGDLFDTTVCPLARRLRSELKTRGVGRGITCVYSVEHIAGNKAAAADASSEARAPLGSLATIPGIFGLTIAQTAVDLLIGRAPR